MTTPSLWHDFLTFVDDDPSAVSWIDDDGRSGHTSTTRAEMAARVAVLAEAVRESGHRAGDPLLVCRTSGSGFVAAFWACMALGSPAVPGPPPPAGHGRAVAEDRLAAIAATAGATHVLRDDADEPSVTDVARLPAHAVAHRSSSHSERGRLDVAFLQYTSGSTGTPRGCIVSHDAVRANTAAIASMTDLPAQCHGVNWCPMHHDLGLVTSVLLPVLWPGLTAVLLPAKAFAARPNRWMSLVARYGAVITAGPNTALELAARQARRLEPGTDLSSLQCLVTGAEPVRPDTVRRFESALAPYGMPAGTVKPAYGMAEATLLVSMATAGLRTRRLDPSSKRSGHARPAAPGAPGVEVASVGKAAPGAQVRIRSDGPSTPEGIIGPVEVRTPSACDGYVGDDAASAALFSEDGWLRTGDLGFIDRGELYITGRSKDTIIVAGQNIEPVDLEQLALQAAPEAIGVAAVGRESRQGETPCVLIEMRHRSTTSAQVDVQRHIAAVLGLAVDVICVAPGALPRTSSGKVQRRAAVSLLADDSTQDTRSRTPARDGVMA